MYALIFISLQSYSSLVDQVEIQVELEDIEEEATHEEELFDIDPFDTVIGQDGDDDNSDESDDEDNMSDLSSDAGYMDDDDLPADLPTNVQHVRDMVKKLDAILKLIFDHLNIRHPVVTPDALTPSESVAALIDALEIPSPPSSVKYTKAERHSQFHTLLAIFDRTILRTFKSRYTQFLIFWYSSIDAEFSDIFQGMLVSKALLEDDQPAVTRAAAASYISSFVSRAQFVDREGARRVTAVLCNYIQSDLDTFDVQSHSGVVLSGNANHSVFYAISQAIFLIFCFRWRDLLEEAEEDVDELQGRPKAGRTWMSELAVVQRLVVSPLNPLKVCVILVFTELCSQVIV
jgi:RNA polymerase I-specific transcription initiation factor RRN3